jgi:hypothetical protein
MTKEDIDRIVNDIHVHSCPPQDEVTCPKPRRENGPNLNPQKRVGYERQGAGYDPGACGHELQGRK